MIYFGPDMASPIQHKRILDATSPENLFSTPITETMFANAAIGMALAGARPIFDVCNEDFLSLAFDAIANQATKHHFWDGKTKVPVVYCGGSGVLAGLGNNHTQKVTGWFTNLPGLKICVPSNAYEMKGLIKSAIRDDDPVLFLRHSGLGHSSCEVPDDPDFVIPFGKADVAREGTDITIVCWQLGYKHAMGIADKLAEDGISVEIITPRTLCPLDIDTMAESVRKTGRLIVAHEEPYKFGPGAEIVTQITERAMDSLKAAPIRVATPMSMIPTFKLEHEFVLTKEQLFEACYKVMGRTAPEVDLSEEQINYYSLKQPNK